MDRRPKQILLQRRHTNVQQTREKIFKISHYQRNANQNYHGVSRHTSQNGHHQKNLRIINGGWRGYGEKEILLPCWGM